MNVVLILSGGMDSATLLYALLDEGHRVSALTMDYGQRHRKEILAAKRIAHRRGVEWEVVDLSAAGRLLKGSALTDDVPMPHGHYKAENMRLTVTPNRNAFLLALAYGHAISIGAEAVAYAAHAGDHYIYPDCRPPFVEALQTAFQLGSDTSVSILAPFLHLTKGDIAKLGDGLGVPWVDTWTCYEGGALHCGACGACNERKEAFSEAGLTDPTIYAEP